MVVLGIRCAPRFPGIEESTMVLDPTIIVLPRPGWIDPVDRPRG